jgi:uncharacterized membrane protein (DUF106 family)
MKDLLVEEVKSELGELSKLDVGTQEYTAAITGITKLMEKSVEIDRFEAEKLDKLNLNDQERLKREQMEQERKDRLSLQEMQMEIQRRQIKLQEEQQKANVRNNTLQILTMVGTTVLTAAITVWGTNTTLEFEKEGTVTTSAGKSFLGKLFNKK